MTFWPDGHVALVGEPRAGRSDLLEGLRRVLSSDAIRYTTPSELDFWMTTTEQRAEVEVVLGDLGSELEQDFIDHLEAWDHEQSDLFGSRPPTEAASSAEVEWVLRLCYRAEWDADQEQATHWVDFPDESDPSAGTFVRVPKRLHDRLPVTVVESRRRPLRLHPRADFRRLLDSVGSRTIADDFDNLVDSVASAGEVLAKSADLSSLVGEVLTPVAGPLGIDADDDGLVQFVPEGGSLSGLLRSLQPAIDLGPPGHLPLHRHGASSTALVQAGEAIAALGQPGMVLLVDDFGEDLDPISSEHLSATLRRHAGQAWISTRRSSSLGVFRVEEIVRLHTKSGGRLASQLDPPTTRAERIAMRHLSMQLLPAASAATVAIVEGPHDRAALDALARRRFLRSGEPLPASFGIAIVDAGAADGSGGASSVVRLAGLARNLGFHTVAVIDGDPGKAGEQALADAEAAADCVVRLPDGFAVERAIVSALDDGVLTKTLKMVCSATGAQPPSGLDELSGRPLGKAVEKALKSSGGLHAQFVELLPRGRVPPRLRAVLEKIIDAGRQRLEGVEQL
ncbi:MAG: hypothetical protein QNJ12_00030 [Ilumatobacter sp.]|uniref:hypothetical protein n=1 Tax=Ilumatobacter sp. TaxID=1967498 RepID=UPI0026067145|nr:hypothetical protein [Ilumatobacter sp.]MDJ0767138.1 hypothetical protein [Ilumatobacter sp.]